MTRTNQLINTLLLLGLVTSQALPLSARTRTEVIVVTGPAHTRVPANEIDWGKVALYTCGVGLIVGGVCALYNYLHVPNQKLIEDTQILLDQTKRYHSQVELLRSNELANDNLVPETVLNLLAQKVGTGVNITRYISEIQKLTKELDAKLRKINKRRAKIERRLLSCDGLYSGRLEDQRLVDTMLNLEQAGQRVITDLSLLDRCLQKHRDYLELHQAFTIYQRRYRTEITALNSQRSDQIKQLARGAVASEQVLYPLIQYSRMLKNDKSCLAQVLNALRSHYPTLTAQAEQLLDHMNQIYRLIVSDSEYVQEQNARREAEQREERLRIERERLALEQQKLIAELNQPAAQQTVIIHHH